MGWAVVYALPKEAESSYRIWQTNKFHYITAESALRASNYERSSGGVLLRQLVTPVGRGERFLTTHLVDRIDESFIEVLAKITRNPIRKFANDGNHVIMQIGFSILAVFYTENDGSLHFRYGQSIKPNMRRGFR